MDIVHQVLNQLSSTCHCEITTKILNEGSFACFKDSEKTVTYRAKLSGTSSLSTAFLLSLLEDWVSSGPVVKVGGVLMRVDPQYQVPISSLSEEECLRTISSTSETTIEYEENGNSQRTDTIPAIVGSTVCGLFVFIVAATIIAIVVLSRFYLVKQSADGKTVNE